MDDYLRSICDADGVFLCREAKALGYDTKTIARMVRSGRWHRVRHGAYTFGDIWTGLRDGERHQCTTRAVLKNAHTEVVASHRSAIVEHTDGWWDLDLSEVDVTRTDGKTGRREAGVRQHRGLLLPSDIEERNGILVTGATRSALDLTTVTDVEHSLVPIDRLIHEGKTSLQAMAERYAAGMEQWPQTLATDLTLRLADGRAESPGETRARYLFWQQGLPTPVLQYEVRDHAGRLLGTTDFAWPEHRVFGEFDGMTKYQTLLRPGETAADAVIREKLREQRLIEETGWRFIRFIWADLYRPEHTAARVRRILGVGSPRRFSA